jgi:hypothetical protein
MLPSSLATEGAGLDTGTTYIRIGGFGDVQRGMYQGNPVAIKCLRQLGRPDKSTYKVGP